MSLVYEALQKAEREKQRKAGVAPLPPAPVRESKPAPVAAPPPPPPAAVAPARATQPWMFGLIASVSVVALVAIVFLVANAVKPAPSAPTIITNNVTATTAPPAAVTAEAPLPSLNPVDDRFRITGIMRDSDGRYGAVLNGKIVYEGYYVEGATVKSISQDRAILDIGGKETVVRLY